MRGRNLQFDVNVCCQIYNLKKKDLVSNLSNTNNMYYIRIYTTSNKTPLVGTY
jgi:hypothetical protein